MERRSGLGSRHRSWMQSFLKTARSHKEPYRNPIGATGNCINMMLQCQPYQRSVKMLLDIQVKSGVTVGLFLLNFIAPSSIAFVFKTTKLKMLSPTAKQITNVIFNKSY